MFGPSFGISVLELAGVILFATTIVVAFARKARFHWPVATTVAWLTAACLTSPDLLSTVVLAVLLLAAFYFGTRQHLAASTA